MEHLAGCLVLAPVEGRHPSDTVLIVDGTLVPTHDRAVSARSKNYRYSANLQVVIDANTRLTAAVGTPLPGNRNDCRAYTESGADRRKQDLNTAHRGVRARVEHALARMKTWKILRDCRRKGLGVWYAARGVALMRNLTMTI